MSMNRLSKAYAEGVKSFLEFAKKNAKHPDFIRCPYTSCGNTSKWKLTDIKAHLYIHGIDQTYREWRWPGEDVTEAPLTSNKDDTIHKDFVMEAPEDVLNTIEKVQAGHEDFMGNFENFQKLLGDAHKPLYRGCKKFTKLSASVNLFNLKAKRGWTDTSFSQLLELFAKMLPEETSCQKKVPTKLVCKIHGGEPNTSFVETIRVCIIKNTLENTCNVQS